MDKKNFYELTYIINPVLEENQTKETVEKYNNFLKENEATIDQVDEWGIRELAYEINNKKSGYYVNVHFEANGDVIAKLERTMRIDDNIMRNLAIKFDSKMKRHYELKKKGEAPDIFAKKESEEE
ncbi:MAG TPA: 30S ribosomal protein S6 [Balneolales bacterium]|nr:30S ribosomal protein S6 [Balneolales bacterium]